MSILFDGNTADALNDAVKSKVAAHLFMFCNYNPGPVDTYSVDARFIQGVLNLYKLLIDCSIVGSVTKMCANAISQSRLYDLKHYRNDASVLRTALAHNIDARNWTGEAVCEYTSWLQRESGKDKAESADDYAVLLQKLETIANDAMAILNDFVDKIAMSEQKDDAIARWENCIIDFYSKGTTGKQIFEGQLRDAYLATHTSARRNGCKNLDVARWIQEEYKYMGRKVESRIYGCMNHYCSSGNIKETLTNALAQKDKWQTMLPEGIVQYVVYSDFGLNLLP